MSDADCPTCRRHLDTSGEQFMRNVVTVALAAAFAIPAAMIMFVGTDAGHFRIQEQNVAANYIDAMTVDGRSCPPPSLRAIPTDGMEHL